MEQQKPIHWPIYINHWYPEYRSDQQDPRNQEDCSFENAFFKQISHSMKTHNRQYNPDNVFPPSNVLTMGPYVSKCHGYDGNSKYE